MIEKEDAVEVVDLVLDRARLVALRFDAEPLAAPIQRFHDDACGSLHITEDVGNGEAALLGRLFLLAALDNHRVDKGEWRWIFVPDVHDSDATRHTDLIGSQTDAFRGPHGLEQILHDLAHVVIHGLYRLCVLSGGRGAEGGEGADGPASFVSSGALS